MTPIQAGYNEHSLSLQTPRRIEIYIALLNHPPGGGLLGLILAGYVPLASQSLYPIIFYSLTNCRPHISHSGANM